MAKELSLKESITLALQSKKIKFNTNTKGDTCLIDCKPGSSHIGGSSIYISVKGNDYVKFYAYPIREIDSVRRKDVLEALNKKNNEYKYVKGMIDKDGDILFEYDTKVCGTIYKSTSMIMELFDLVLSIMDLSYTEVKRVLTKEVVYEKEPEFNFNLFNDNDDE